MSQQFRPPPNLPEMFDAACKVEMYMRVNDVTRLSALQLYDSRPLSREQANRLRDLVQKHIPTDATARQEFFSAIKSLEKRL